MQNLATLIKTPTYVHRCRCPVADDTASADPGPGVVADPAAVRRGELH